MQKSDKKEALIMTLQTLTEHEIIATFLSLTLLLAGAYLCGKLMEAIKAPRVVGEITGGLLFAVTMNARGGPGIVLATVAYSAQIISVEFFTVLILTTMLSSLIAGYWLRHQQKKDDSIFMELTKNT